MMIQMGERLSRFLNVTKVRRTKGGLWFPELDIVLPKHMNILAVLRTPEGRYLHPAHNIVTDAGDQWYAQKAAGEAVTNDFNRHAMASARTAAWAKSGTASQYGNATVISGSSKANDTGYPKTNDTDADNTGDAIDAVTHRVSYLTSEANGTIVAGLIHKSTDVTATGPLLTGYDFTSFTKTSSDTLKVFVNHTFNGA